MRTRSEIEQAIAPKQTNLGKVSTVPFSDELIIELLLDIRDSLKELRLLGIQQQPRFSPIADNKLITPDGALTEEQFNRVRRLKDDGYTSEEATADIDFKNPAEVATAFVFSSYLMYLKMRARKVPL